MTPEQLEAAMASIIVTAKNDEDAAGREAVALAAEVIACVMSNTVLLARIEHHLAALVAEGRDNARFEAVQREFGKRAR